MENTLSKDVVSARIKGEAARNIENILARTELPKKQFWLSFVGEEGFRGVCIVHANDCMEALMEANMKRCNPHGECQMMEIPSHIVVPADWTYRVLTKEQCQELERKMVA